MNRNSEKIAVILLNLGAPESLDDIKPFLYNLFSDPDIIDLPMGKILRPILAWNITRKRLPESTNIYEKIGGGSPLRALSQKQAEVLEFKLSENGDFKVYIAMRYWHPFTESVVEKMSETGINKAILLPLYPQYSITSTGSSLHEFERVIKRRKDSEIEFRLIHDYHDFHPYIDALTERLLEGIEKFDGVGDEDLHLLFSAHGVPLSVIEKGDPYENQVRTTVNLVMSNLENKYHHSISFQSRVTKVEWLTPATDKIIPELGKNGVKNLLVIPVAFVNDHSETLFELGIFNRDLALKAGIKRYEVMPALNDSPKFISALSELVLQMTESWDGTN